MSSNEIEPLEPESLDIDPNGDLVLDVSSSVKRLIRVSSNALCLVSPVFRAMLGPSSQFQEARSLYENTTGSAAQIILSDDDYPSLVIMMNVVHHRNRKVPTKINVDELYKLTVVCDKYDCAEIFVPWVILWTDGVSNVTREAGYERWFLISWVFRLGNIFKEVTNKLILETMINEEDCLTTGTEYPVDIGSIPDSVIGAIRCAREGAIKSLILLATEEIDKYTSSAVEKSTVCQLVFTGGKYTYNTKKRKECDTIAIGALLRCLHPAGLWLGKQETESRTVSNIGNVLRSIESFNREIIEISTSLPNQVLIHKNCGPKSRLTDGVKSVLERLEGLELEDLHMKDKESGSQEKLEQVSNANMDG